MGLVHLAGVDADAWAPCRGWWRRCSPGCRRNRSAPWWRHHRLGADPHRPRWRRRSPPARRRSGRSIATAAVERVGLAGRQHHAGPCRREPGGDRQPDPLRCAGDQRDLSVESVASMRRRGRAVRPEARAASGRSHEPPGRRDQPLPPPARGQPGRLVPLGRRGLRTRPATEDKPILLSVGYSACHWCHVMAHESFEDAGVAAVMNEHFVNIKVDREERPGRRRHLHGGDPGDHRFGRVADDGVPDAGPPAVLRRHLLPEAPSSSSCSTRCDDAWVTKRSDLDAQADQLTDRGPGAQRGDGARHHDGCRAAHPAHGLRVRFAPPTIRSGAGSGGRRSSR